MRNRLLLVLSVFILSACAGTPFEWSKARQVKDGMATQEVSELLGKPYSVSATGGVVRYVWVYVNGLTYGTRSLSIDFVDGRVVKVPFIPEEFQD